MVFPASSLHTVLWTHTWGPGQTSWWSPGPDGITDLKHRCQGSLSTAGESKIPQRQTPEHSPELVLPAVLSGHWLCSSLCARQTAPNSSATHPTLGTAQPSRDTWDTPGAEGTGVGHSLESVQGGQQEKDALTKEDIVQNWPGDEHSPKTVWI